MKNLDILQNFTALAPMEGVTDFVTRIWLYQTSGISSMHTPFLRVTDSYPASLSSQSFLWGPELLCSDLRSLVPYTLIPQLMASDPKRCVEVALQFCKMGHKVELNCGCPAPTVVGHGAGSRLLHDPKLFEDFIYKLSSSLPVDSLSVKMRTGFEGTDHFRELIDILGVHSLWRVVIHGRTRKDRYRGKSRWDLIQQAAKTMSVPVWGSGDICSLEGLLEKQSLAPRVAGVLLGRGQLRNPWLQLEFRQKKNVLMKTHTLKYALLVYVMMCDLWIHDPVLFIQFAGKNNIFEQLGVAEEKWFVFYEKILKFNNQKLCDIRGRSLGKLKMLWNYLRTSLPSKFHTRDFLRVKSAYEFVELYDNISINDSHLLLKYNPECDHLFSR